MCNLPYLPQSATQSADRQACRLQATGTGYNSGIKHTEHCWHACNRHFNGFSACSFAALHTAFDHVLADLYSARHTDTLMLNRDATALISTLWRQPANPDRRMAVCSRSMAFNAAANAAAAAAAAAHVFGYGQRKQGDAAASATVHGHDGATLKHAQSTVRADSGTLPVHGAQVKYRYQIILPCTCLQFSNLAHSSEQIFPFVCGKEPFYA